MVMVVVMPLVLAVLTIAIARRAFRGLVRERPGNGNPECGRGGYQGQAKTVHTPFPPDCADDPRVRTIAACPELFRSRAAISRLPSTRVNAK